MMQFRQKIVKGLQHAFLVTLALSALPGYAEETSSPTVVMETSEGTLHIVLDPQGAPLSTQNFLQYVNDGFYDGTVFHRVIPGFMVQGGGFTEDFTQKNTRAAITNESAPELRNLRGTLAMARTQAPHSATAQFFINLVDNPHLDARQPGSGYAVFGRVVEGMDVVDRMAAIPTQNRGFMRDVPQKAITILSVRVDKSAAPAAPQATPSQE